MGTIRAHAGDFISGGKHRFERNKFRFQRWSLLPFTEMIRVSDIALLEQMTEDNKVKVLGALGWGLAGSVALGGVGALAGLVLGGRGKKVYFACAFKDGRRLVGETDPKTFAEMAGASFAARGGRAAEDGETASIPARQGAAQVGSAPLPQERETPASALHAVLLGCRNLAIFLVVVLVIGLLFQATRPAP